MLAGSDPKLTHNIVWLQQQYSSYPKLTHNIVSLQQYNSYPKLTHNIVSLHQYSSYPKQTHNIVWLQQQYSSYPKLTHNKVWLQQQYSCYPKLTHNILSLQHQYSRYTHPAVVLWLAYGSAGTEGLGALHHGGGGGQSQLLIGPFPANQRRLDEDTLRVRLLVHVLTGLQREQEGILQQKMIIIIFIQK